MHAKYPIKQALFPEGVLAFQEGRDVWQKSFKQVIVERIDAKFGGFAELIFMSKMLLSELILA